jgi:hypothetical protein
MIFGRNLTKLTDSVLRARFADWKQRQVSAESMQASADEIMKTIRHDAQAAGMESALDALLAPPPPPIAAEPMARVRATKPYRLLHNGPHGYAEYSGGVNAVNDIPRAALKKLAGRVVEVPATTAMVGVPLEAWMSTED